VDSGFVSLQPRLDDKKDNKDNDSNSNDNDILCEVYKVAYSGHVLLVDNPLGLAEAMMLGLDENNRYDRTMNSNTIVLGHKWIDMDKQLAQEQEEAAKQSKIASS
jgi:hypothetical protein